jgi:hypothetical protein
MADLGLAMGLERATGNLQNTALNLQQLQNQTRHMRALEADSSQRLALEGRRVAADESRNAAIEDQRAVQTRLLKMEEDKIKKDTTPIDFNDVLDSYGIKRPEERKVLEKYVAPYLERVEGGSGKPLIQPKYLRSEYERLGKDYQGQLELTTARAKGIANERQTLLQQKVEVKKPEEIAQIDGRLKEINAEETANDLVIKRIQQQVRAANKDKYQNVQLPNGQWVAQDTATGDTIPLGGTQEGVVKTRQVEAAKDNRAQMQAGKSPLQQSVFTDPETGLPLTFNKANGSYEIAQVQGGGVAPRPINPSATEREKTAQYDVIREQIKRIKDDYKSKYVGLVSGQVGKVTQFKDSEEAAFRQVILDVKDSLLRARSGAQINEQEYARLSKLVPDFTDSESQFKGKMRSFEQTFESIAKQRAKAQSSGGVFIRNQETRAGKKPLSAY